MDSNSSARTATALLQDHFRESARFWRDVYAAKGVYAAIHQLRRSAVLSLVDDLRLEPGSNAVDVGCGAGSISVALALRGLNVNAVDQVPEMLRLTEDAAAGAGVESSVATCLGDINDLRLPGSSSRLVLAIGVLPWLSDYKRPLKQIAGVLEPGGYAIVNIDNCWALHRLLDPATNVLSAPLSRTAGRLLRSCGVRLGDRGARTTQISPRGFHTLLESAGLKVRRGLMLGFGPISFFGRPLLSEPHGLEVHRRLQSLCDRRAPLIRSMGAQYLVVARKEPGGRCEL